MTSDTEPSRTRRIDPQLAQALVEAAGILRQPADLTRHAHSVVITAPEANCGGSLGWRTVLLAPKATATAPVLESYACSSAENAAWVASLLLTGEPVPAGYYSLGSGVNRAVRSTQSESAYSRNAAT